MRFAYLSEHAALAPAVAAAHHAEFAALLPQWTVAQAQAELATHAGTCTVPTTLLAFDADGDWLGCVSLLQNDHERIRAYSPWLASLVVRDTARGRGIGAALVARCIEEAAALGVQTLHLYCEERLVPYYERQGWRAIDRAAIGAMHGAAEVVVMAIDPLPAERAA